MYSKKLPGPARGRGYCNYVDQSPDYQRNAKKQSHGFLCIHQSQSGREQLIVGSADGVRLQSICRSVILNESQSTGI